MYARHLSLSDYRSWSTAEVPLQPGVNVLIGRNGTGKTNLVEALGYLATLASHRVASDAPLIRRGTERAIVRAAVVSEDRELLLEVEITTGRANRARINRSPLTRPRDILGVLRTVLFAPEDLALVRGDPTERRKFLDEVLIMRAPRLAGVRADYDRVLKQRNALLKTAGAARRSGGDLTTLDVWDEHLAAAGACWCTPGCRWWPSCGRTSRRLTRTWPAATRWSIWPIARPSRLLPATGLRPAGPARRCSEAGAAVPAESRAARLMLAELLPGAVATNSTAASR